LLRIYKRNAIGGDNRLGLLQTSCRWPIKPRGHPLLPMAPGEYFDPEIETIDAASLRALQESKLREQLDYLWERSPFYGDKFHAAGVKRGDFRALPDIARFPFTTKEELRKSQAASPPLGRHAAATMRDVVRIHSSTGTTGRPSFVGVTRRDAEIWTRITARSFYVQGIRPEDIVIHAAGLTLFVGGLPSKDAIELIGATFVPVGPGASENLVLVAKALGANALHCTPSYAIYLADYVRREAKMNPRDLGFKKIVCGAEPGAGIPSVRARMVEEWGARVTEGLGNADMAPIIFGECPEQRGMHFNGADFILAEIIDPQTEEGQPIEAGVSGELVYTSLERECVPLLRFRTRDRVTVTESACPCGRTSFALRCVGRTDDMLIVLGVNVYPAAVKDVVSSFYPQTTGEMQILLDEPGPGVKPPLRLQAEVASTSNGATVGSPAALGLKSEIEKKIKAVLSVSAAVELVPAGSLPRYEMKGQLVRKLYEGRG
jgi:phenylacetate-CoA ligase